MVEVRACPLDDDWVGLYPAQPPGRVPETSAVTTSDRRTCWLEVDRDQPADLGLGYRVILVAFGAGIASLHHTVQWWPAVGRRVRSGWPGMDLAARLRYVSCQDVAERGGFSCNVDFA